jgi:hypothetical protein
MNWTVKKKVNFVNSSQNEGFSPSGIDLSFDRFGSILWHSVWFSFDGYFRFHISPPDFQLFWPEHHLRDFSSRNAHLVHQNWLGLLPVVMAESGSLFHWKSSGCSYVHRVMFREGCIVIIRQLSRLSNRIQTWSNFVFSISNALFTGSFKSTHWYGGLQRPLLVRS